MTNQKRNTKTENATPEIKQANKRLNPIFGDNSMMIYKQLERLIILPRNPQLGKRFSAQHKLIMYYSYK